MNQGMENYFYVFEVIGKVLGILAFLACVILYPLQNNNFNELYVLTYIPMCIIAEVAAFLETKTTPVRIVLTVIETILTAASVYLFVHFNLNSGLFTNMNFVGSVGLGLTMLIIYFNCFIANMFLAPDEGLKDFDTYIFKTTIPNVLYAPIHYLQYPGLFLLIGAVTAVRTVEAWDLRIDNFPVLEEFKNVFVAYLGAEILIFAVAFIHYIHRHKNESDYMETTLFPQIEDDYKYSEKRKHFKLIRHIISRIRVRKVKKKLEKAAKIETEEKEKKEAEAKAKAALAQKETNEKPEVHVPTYREREEAALKQYGDDVISFEDFSSEVEKALEKKQTYYNINFYKIFGKTVHGKRKAKKAFDITFKYKGKKGLILINIDMTRNNLKRMKYIGGSDVKTNVDYNLADYAEVKASEKYKKMSDYDKERMDSTRYKGKAFLSDDDVYERSGEYYSQGSGEDLMRDAARRAAYEVINKQELEASHQKSLARTYYWQDYYDEIEEIITAIWKQHRVCNVYEKINEDSDDEEQGGEFHVYQISNLKVNFYPKRKDIDKYTD